MQMRDLCSFGMLRSVNYYLVTDLSGRLSAPSFKVKQYCLSAFLHFIVSGMFLSAFTLCSTSFFTCSVLLIFSFGRILFVINIKGEDYCISALFWLWEMQWLRYFTALLPPRIPMFDPVKSF